MKTIKTSVELPNGMRVTWSNKSNQYLVSMFANAFKELNRQYSK